MPSNHSAKSLSRELDYSLKRAQAIKAGLPDPDKAFFEPLPTFEEREAAKRATEHQKTVDKVNEKMQGILERQGIVVKAQTPEPVATSSLEIDVPEREMSDNAAMYDMPTPERLDEIRKAHVRRDYIEPAHQAIEASQQKTAS